MSNSIPIVRVGALALLLTVGCGDESDPDAMTDERVDASTACSTGPVYDDTTTFAHGQEEDVDTVCTPHCGARAPEPWALGASPML